MKSLELSTGTVLVDTDGLKTTDDMVKLMGEAMSDPELRAKKWTFCSFRDFGSRVKALESMSKVDSDLLDRLEFLGIEVDSKELSMALLVLQDVKTKICGATIPYVLASVPAGGLRDFEPEIRISSSKVMTDVYSVPLGVLETVAKQCIRFWGGDENAKTFREYSFDGYRKVPRVTDDALHIGCQKFPRWVVEQLSIGRGWLVA